MKDTLTRGGPATRLAFCTKCGFSTGIVRVIAPRNKADILNRFLEERFPFCSDFIQPGGSAVQLTMVGLRDKADNY